MADRVVVGAGVVHADLVPEAMSLLRKGGTCVIVGVTPLTEALVPLNLGDVVNSSKVIKGSLYGGMNPRADIPHLLSLYQAKALKLDELVTRRYRLTDINDAIADLREGRNIRGIIEFEMSD
jgi:S-(hydroxymethyl)glutathione dehydrogenase/alcohol dehydrogenase